MLQTRKVVECVGTGWIAGSIDDVDVELTLRADDGAEMALRGEYDDGGDQTPLYGTFETTGDFCRTAPAEGAALEGESISGDFWLTPWSEWQDLQEADPRK